MNNKKVKTFNEFHDLGDNVNNNLSNLVKMKYDRIVKGEGEYLVTVSLKEMNINPIRDDYFIAMGYNPIFNGNRVKIVNKITKKTFIILLNDTLDVYGDYSDELLTDEDILNIKKWVKLNFKILKKFSETDDFSLDFIEFLYGLKKLQ